jgi:antitoxin component YwqK of YwqJK toxin-antitoxin module
LISILESKGQTFDTIYSKYGQGIESIGQRLNGRKVGRWIKYDNYRDKSIAAEYYYNSIDSTVLCSFYRNGNLICTEYRYYVNDSTLLQHGYSQWYVSNYVVDFGTYYYGKSHGLHVSYHPFKRTIYEIAHYQYGILQDSFFRFHDNGQLFEVGCYKNDQRIGVWKEYHENGSIAAVGEYLGKSKLIDVTKQYIDIEVQTKVDFNYKKGKWSYYSEEGLLIKVEIYDISGELINCFEGKQLKKMQQ